MNLVASILSLDRVAVQALRLTDPYSVHRIVYSLYPDVRSVAQKATGEPSGILYADRGANRWGHTVLLLANRMPAGHAVDDQGQACGAVVSRSIPSGFLDHDEYRFRVVVNPTRRDAITRRRMALLDQHAVAQWFEARALSNWGFAIPAGHLRVGRLKTLQFTDKARHPVTLVQAPVQGRLVVIDRTRFRRSFCRGIGRGRAFGCGLLQIVPSGEPS